ncbi:DJ-1/PfpI family protein [Ammoniphilus sp. CFH 90114]|uniref:DJ-1/PfpI family protein n=1 Tax=Ammoniphilus sp. CFH 90114 TaxID=2493665 RepID=UPI00100F6144|nr:DJ-1/PfpI family protein [Ammoniphilus sp. CFH 90114]RXT06956.1 DJ-1/PfpI family protein [Ammoniphilus sp. CFH 90114]
MKIFFVRFFVYLSVFVLIVGGIGALGALHSRADWLSVRDMPAPTLQGVKVPDFHPNKPTVAVVLGDPLTEVFDFMVPYEMFAMTEAYNVFAVAPENKVTSLTGGLDIVPHFSFKELDQLLEKSPDLIVVPYMPMVDEEKYRPVREWIQQHENTQFLSICSGSRNMAEAGLLKGNTSTIHWRIVHQVEKLFPDTNWIRDQRYVQDGNVTSSAGLTSGIDAVLYVISQQLGESMADKVAKEMNYPSYHFVENPKVEPYYIDQTEVVYYLNLAFQFHKKKVGVLLYEGMEEGALASIFDTYSPLGTTKVFTLSDSYSPIVTKHHLNLITRSPISQAPTLDRILVTGTNLSSLDVEMGEGVEPEFIHRGTPDRFVFDATLEDLAMQEDRLTAEWAAKRLEYRANHLKLEGKPFPIEAFFSLLFLSAIALLTAYFVDRRFIVKHKS